MVRLGNYATLLVLAWGARARAEGPPAPDVTSNAQPSAPPALSDEELLRQSQTETIEIFDERPDKPFDRDTEVRLTGEQLAARGAVDLGTALALLPDVSVRDAGRGGFNIDIRGARKGAVSILVDGVLVTDPYYGTFDVSSIPITDIVQIRVATTPQSPIDGPGGPGGVIEVHTRDAIGAQLVIARASGDTLFGFGATATARAPLARDWALRVSASGAWGGRGLPMAMGQSLDEERHEAAGAARLEYRRGDRRLAIDVSLDDRHYIVPPSDVDPSPILRIDREAEQRGSAKLDDRIGKVQLQGELWFSHLYRRSLYYGAGDINLATVTQLENLDASRTGGQLLATQPLGKDWRWAASASFDRDGADVTNLANRLSTGIIQLAEAAGDVQFERRTVRVDGAVGVAIPIGVGADPWPEAKLVGRWRPSFGKLELVGTVARKGRLPSLRERFDVQDGNPALGPEMIDHVELRTIVQLDERVRVEVAPFYKHTTGTIRASPIPADMGKLINLGALDFFGVDAIVRVRVHRTTEIGGAYDYIRAKEEVSATMPAVGNPNDPLDRLPRNRAEGWVQVTPERRFALLARVQYFGWSIAQGTIVPDYTLVSATATAQLSRRFLAVLRVDDLLDARPETNSMGNAVYHAPGRTITLIVQGQWE
jgi:outer membrane receptor protein involved in Fe transport